LSNECLDAATARDREQPVTDERLHARPPTAERYHNGHVTCGISYTWRQGDRV
jgi:hypothetical protein